MREGSLKYKNERAILGLLFIVIDAFLTCSLGQRWLPEMLCRDKRHYYFLPVQRLVYCRRNNIQNTTELFDTGSTVATFLVGPLMSFGSQIRS